MEKIAWASQVNMALCLKLIQKQLFKKKCLLKKAGTRELKCDHVVNRQQVDLLYLLPLKAFGYG